MTDTPSKACPLCGQELGEPQAVEICHGCHDNVLGSANIRVANTGEFRVDQIMAAAHEFEADSAPQVPSTISCSWCGKSKDDARKLLSRGSAHICNECVALCADVMAAELGDDWR